MNQQEKTLSALGHTALLRLRDLQRMGISDSAVRRLVSSGRVERISRGVYSLAERTPEQYESLAETALRHPRAVVCLLSAARLHDLTTSNTPYVWIALPHGTRAPAVDGISLKTKFWRNPKLFELGVETIEVAGVPVRVTDPARTITDLFRPHNRMIDERAHEALWHFLDEGGDRNQLFDYAKEFGIEETIASCVGMASCRTM